ncbi:MAG: LemA family protein [Gammaproteobacteria bacterium]|nr:LemA family protein [Gammaproteobacteria bacterium]MCP5200446.1 LemA family protein [Gammaproteobacteria bacterium]
MDLGTIIFLVVVAIVLGYGILLYNALVTLKHNVSKAWSNIDVLLKQRHDEIPKLVEICKQYMAYEKDTLERVIAARAAVSAARERGDVGRLGAAETQLRSGLGNLFAVAEAYPDLKADKNFKHLQDRISALEDAIADRREYYNDSVNLNNTRIEQFPDVLIARWFNFGARDLLEFSAEEKKDVDLKALFN